MFHFYFMVILSFWSFETSFASEDQQPLKRIRVSRKEEEVLIPLWVRRGVPQLFLNQSYINKGLKIVTPQTSSEKTRRFFNDVCALEQTIVCASVAIPRQKIMEEHVRLLIHFRRLKSTLSITGQEHAAGPLLNIMRTIIKNP